MSATLLNKLRAIRERSVRIGLLSEALERSTPAALTDLLAALVELCLLGAPPGEDALLAFIPAFDALSRQREGYELIRELYTHARVHSAEGSNKIEDLRAQSAARMLLTLASHRKPPARSFRFGPKWERDLSLGERKALASGPQRRYLERLIYDADAPVVAKLCLNPRVVEQDILLIATRRPVKSELLEEIARSQWLSRYRVRHALALNPYSNTGLVLRLLPMLHDKDLRAFGFVGEVHPQVRAHALHLVAHKARALALGVSLSDWLAKPNTQREDAVQVINLDGSIADSATASAPDQGADTADSPRGPDDPDASNSPEQVEAAAEAEPNEAPRTVSEEDEDDLHVSRET